MSTGAPTPKTSELLLLKLPFVAKETCQHPGGWGFYWACRQSEFSRQQDDPQHIQPAGYSHWGALEGDDETFHSRCRAWTARTWLERGAKLQGLAVR